MRILDRYILRELVGPFVLGLLIFTSLLLILRILKLVELVVSRGVPASDVLRLFACILPAFLEVTVPMALLLAVLVALGRLSADSELTALHACGVGTPRVAVPVGLFAIVVTAAGLTLALYVRPLGNRLLRQSLYEIVKARATAGLQPKVFNDDFENLVIYAEGVGPSGRRLDGVLVSDGRTPGERTIIYSRHGLVVSDERSQTLILRLVDGGIYSAPLQGDGFQHTRFATYDVRLDLSRALAKLRRHHREPAEMSLGELRAEIQVREGRGLSAAAERIELHRRWAIPTASLLFAATAIPLGIRRPRSVHSWGMAVSVIVVFGYYLLLTLGESLAARGVVPPGPAIWLPNLVLGVVTAVLLLRTEVSAELGAATWARGAWLKRIASLYRRVPSAR